MTDKPSDGATPRRIDEILAKSVSGAKAAAEEIAYSDVEAGIIFVDRKADNHLLIRLTDDAPETVRSKLVELGLRTDHLMGDSPDMVRNWLYRKYDDTHDRRIFIMEFQEKFIEICNLLRKEKGLSEIQGGPEVC
jgi:hypothetical protein